MTAKVIPLSSVTRGKGKQSVNVRHSSKSPDWCTPPEILEATRRTFQGPIEFDPCTSALAQVHVQADDFWTPEDGINPLAIEWNRRTIDGLHVEPVPPRSVFLNPPGGRLADHSSSQKAYWFKLAREWAEGRVREAVFLSFSIELLQTSQVQPPQTTSGYRLPIPLDFPICYFARRVAYYEEREGILVKGASPPHSSCAVYLPDFRQPRLGAGPYTTAGCKLFRRAFGELGHVVCPL